MALPTSDPVVSGVDTAASDCHDTTTEQTPVQVCPEDFSQGFGAHFYLVVMVRPSSIWHLVLVIW